MVFFPEGLCITFSGSDFTLGDEDDVSVYRLFITAADRLVERLVASFKDGVVLDAILLLTLLLFAFQLKEKGPTSSKATLKSVTDFRV